MSRNKLISDLVAGGKMFTVTFIKNDGSIRTINGRCGVTKHLRGGERRYNPEEKDLLSFYSIKDKGYRACHIKKIKNIAAKGVVVAFKE